MKKLMILLLTVLMCFGGEIIGHAADLQDESGLTMEQKAEVDSVADFVDQLREALPVDSTVITPDTIGRTGDTIEYLLKAQGYVTGEYFIKAWTCQNNHAHFDISIFMKTLPGAVFITEATYEFIVPKDKDSDKDIDMNKAAMA